MRTTEHFEADLADQIMSNMSENWEAGEGSAVSIVIDYVRALEKRVLALGGHLEPHDGGQTEARGVFVRLAERHVQTDSVDDWNAMVDAWNSYQRIKAAAE
jgi:hypothetical protein